MLCPNMQRALFETFLSATECDPEEVDLAETPAKPTDHEVDTTWVTSDTIDKLVRGVGFEYSKRSGPAVRRIVEEWESNPQVDTINTWFVNTGITDIKLDRSQSKTQQPTPLRENEPLSWTYGKLTPESATAWLQRLAEQGSVAVDPAACSAEPRSASAEQRSASAEPRSACKPTAEQLKFLRAVVDRCLTESQEEQAERSRSEPLRAVFHGVPGAGKSQTLKWLRAFFEDLCGWQHQQEFVYLAPQNTQAALIAGMTLHAFANIHVKTKTARAKNTSTPEQFAKYQRLRWLVVDESSTVGLEILATLEKRPAAVYQRSGYVETSAGGRTEAIRRAQHHLDRGLVAVPASQSHSHLPEPFPVKHNLPSQRTAANMLVAHPARHPTPV